MKTKLLLLALIVSAFGYSQTYDHTKYWISEIVGSPPNSTNGTLNDSDNPSMALYQSDIDEGIEYFEFRGAPNAVIDNNVYFIVIDGDGDDSDVSGGNIGKVREAINLSGLQFGSNGILAIATDITMNTGTGAVDLVGLDISGTKFINPYATQLANAAANYGATVLTIQLTADTINWTDENPADGTNETLNGFNISSVTPDIGYDGSLNDQSATYMIVQTTGANPKNALVDTVGGPGGLGGDADGVLDGDALTWTIYDSVSVLDDDDITPGNNEVGEFGYGKIIFIEQLLDGNAFLHYDAALSPTVVTLDQYPNYVARQGTKTGFAASLDMVDTNDDWMAGRVNSLSYPDWAFSSNAARNLPSNPLTSNNLSTTSGSTTYGFVNVDFANVLSVDDALASKFSVYPNPASTILNINTRDIQLTSIQVFDLLGKKVIDENSLVNEQLNVSKLSSGIYVLKLNAENGSVSKKIIIE